MESLNRLHQSPSHGTSLAVELSAKERKLVVEDRQPVESLAIVGEQDSSCAASTKGLAGISGWLVSVLVLFSLSIIGLGLWLYLG